MSDMIDFNLAKQQHELPSEDKSPTDEPKRKGGQGVRLEDFYAYMPTHQYIFAPTREMWVGRSVNARLPRVVLNYKGANGEPVTIPPTTWIDRTRPVEQMTWIPGEPMLIRDRLVSDGGWTKRNGVTIFNQYKPPAIVRGHAAQAKPWVDHVHNVYGGCADHIITWLAFKVQRPAVKINHALFFGGDQGIGKDTLIEPVKYAIGPWNFSEVSPQQILGRFNGFLKSVILRVSEARNLGETNKFALYEHMKTYIAAPPDVHRVDEKHLREHSVFNVTGIIFTSNSKDSLYLPADDRRHYVAWSDLTKEDFTEEYWAGIWGFYERGGLSHVTAYLHDYDLSRFNPKAPPPKTDAFWEIVSLGDADENGELRDLLDSLGNPRVITISQLIATSQGPIAVWLQDRKNRKAIAHRLSEVGYIVIPNSADTHDKQWRILGRRQTVYGLKSLPTSERLRAAYQLAKGS
jgi:hypothetical protein